MGQKIFFLEQPKLASMLAYGQFLSKCSFDKCKSIFRNKNYFVYGNYLPQHADNNAINTVGSKGDLYIITHYFVT